MNEFPKNCTECEHTKTCERYYGAIGCKYEKEITKAILEQHERKRGKDKMKKKIRTLLLVAILTHACATTSLACTPRLATPKISIPTITNVKLPENVQEAVNKSAEKHAKEAVKNLKIDWSKIKFNFKS